MIAEKIVNMIMLPQRIPFETTESNDRAEGFEEAFNDYHSLWERHDFLIPSDDIEIFGEYVKNPYCVGAVSKVVVLCHGQTVTRAGIIKYARMFYDLGYNLVFFDERYFGKTTGDFCTLGWKEHEDIFRVCEYARKIFGKDCFLGLMGESMGAGSSLLSLKLHTPDFIVADCPFADTGLLIDDLAKEYAGILGKPAVMRAERLCNKNYPGYSFKKVRPRDAVNGTKVPICFMHGAEDKLINCKHSEMMYESCKNTLSEIHFFDNTDHARSIFNEPDKYEEILNDFIKRVEKSAGI